MMKNILVKASLLTALAFSIGACDKNEDPDSVITSFKAVPATLDAATPAVVVAEEDEGTYPFTFALTSDQVNPITLEVGVGASSTATEGVDFELTTHEIEIGGLEGQDGFEVGVTVLQDGINKEEDETIFLTFTTSGPSGVVSSETKVLTIVDSDVNAMTVSVDFDSEFDFQGETFHLADFVDIDMYVYDSNGDEITGFAGATGANPEEADAEFETDGTYEVWVNFWDRYPFETEKCTDEFGNEYSCLGPLNVPLNLTFTRGGKETTLSYPVATTTNSVAWRRVNNVNTNPYVEYLVATIEVADGVITISDLNGEAVGTLRKGINYVEKNKSEENSLVFKPL
jgi:hypothetical protein